MGVIEIIASLYSVIIDFQIAWLVQFPCACHPVVQLTSRIAPRFDAIAELLVAKARYFDSFQRFEFHVGHVDVEQAVRGTSWSRSRSTLVRNS